MTNKHPLHLFLEYIEQNPAVRSYQLSNIADQWDTHPLFNQAVYGLIRGESSVYKYLGKIMATQESWRKIYNDFWEKEEKKTKSSKSLEEIVHDFFQEIADYNKRKLENEKHN